jgi:hypothetical protein
MWLIAGIVVVAIAVASTAARRHLAERADDAQEPAPDSDAEVEEQSGETPRRAVAYDGFNPEDIYGPAPTPD